MSAFEDYTRASESYDATRSAVGAEVILGCLAAGERALPTLVLLDAGCGTGNYAHALVERVREVVCVDLNVAMLARAREKLAAAGARSRVRFHVGDLAALPFAAASVDAVMVNQVLHHMADTREQGWPVRRRVLRELARVLRPGGVLTVNTCFQSQIRESWWYLGLVPRAVRAMCDRHLRFEELAELLHEAGLEPRGRIVPLDALVQGAHYFDTRGPEKAEWRAGDSLWADVSPEELDAALAMLRELHASGRIEAYVAEHDRRRLELGQITIVHAVKP